MLPSHTTVKNAIKNVFNTHPQTKIRPLDTDEVYAEIIKQDFYDFRDGKTPNRTVGVAMLSMVTNDSELVRVKGIGGKYVYTPIETADLLKLHTKNQFAYVKPLHKTLIKNILFVLKSSDSPLTIDQIYTSIKAFNGYKFKGATPKGSVSGTISLMMDDDKHDLVRVKIDGVFNYTLKSNKDAMVLTHDTKIKQIPTEIIQDGFVYVLSRPIDASTIKKDSGLF